MTRAEIRIEKALAEDVRARRAEAQQMRDRAMANEDKAAEFERFPDHKDSADQAALSRELARHQRGEAAHLEAGASAIDMFRVRLLAGTV